MELALTRRWRFDDATLGELTVSGIPECVTLERTSRIIPAGRYQVVLTVSARAASGALWSPRADHALPLVLNVPGREGIRVHAANFADELDGCIATGAERVGAVVHDSRLALIALIAKIAAALAEAETIWLGIGETFEDQESSPVPS